MASLPEVDHALRDLVERLHATDPRVRARLKLDRTVSCHVVDLDVVYSACFRAGEICDVTTDPCPPAQVRLAADSDDLVALTEGRIPLLTAWGAGRLKIEAPVLDLLKLRNLL